MHLLIHTNAVFKEDSNRSLLSEKKFSKECIRCCVLQNRTMASIEVGIIKLNFCLITKAIYKLTISDFPNQMFGWPSSNLLCGHKPNSFSSFHPQSPFPPINNLIPSKLLFQLELAFPTCKIYKIENSNFILDLPFIDTFQYPYLEILSSTWTPLFSLLDTNL